MNTGLEKVREAQRLRKERGEKTIILTPIQRAQNNPKSKSLAISAKCYDCVYDPLDKGTWRDQVNACTCTDCPLWPVRPVKRAKSEEVAR